MTAACDTSDQISHRAGDVHDVGTSECGACTIAERFGSLMDARPIVIVCLSPDYRILEFNRAAERLYGQTREAVLGQDYFRLFVPEVHRERIAAAIKQALHGHPTGDFESSIGEPGAVERVILWSISRILDTAGPPSGVIAVGRDITERKQTEEALHRYEYIVRNSSDLMAFVDADYVYQTVNTAFLEAFGKTQTQIIGHAIADVLGEKVFRTGVKANVDRCLAGEYVKAEAWFDLPRRGRRCLETHLNPFRNADGVVSGVVIDGRDITEHRQAEQVLIEHERQLRALASELALAGQRERQQVAVGLHDQVGQALAMAKLKLGAALDSNLTANTRRSLEESQALLDQSIQATRSLTFQLSSAVLEELGLEAALQQLIEWFDTENQDTQFVFETDGQPKPMDKDHGAMLYDIARELLFNVVKYARASTASLILERIGDQVQITIEDDGQGFDTACLAKGHSAHGGFGYFSIRERLTYLGGDLELRSSIGGGTRVVTTTPLEAS